MIMRVNLIKLLTSALMTTVLLISLLSSSRAANTQAGTIIPNEATALFSISGSGASSSDSNIALIAVDELINLNVSSLNNANVKVIPGDTNAYQTLLLTNSGNGTETFTVTANWTVSGDQFDPIPVGIFSDTNDNGQYEPGIDLAIPGGNIGLEYAASKKIFVVSNIPETRSDDSEFQGEELGFVEITVANIHGPGTAGQVFPGGGDSGNNAIYQRDFPITMRVAFQIVPSIDVAIEKSSTVADQFDGESPYPGATITYTLLVSATGNGSSNVIVTDSIPENTTYIPGSLTLDDTSLTDEADDDAGDISGDPDNQINVILKDQGAGERTITFSVKIVE